MTNAPALARDYLRRARLRVRAVEALIAVQDFADAVCEAQETVELAVKAVLKLTGLSFPRAHDVSRLLRDPAVTGPVLTPDEVAEVEQASKALRRDRELAVYGDEDVVPLEYYERADADAALVALRRVLELVGKAFERNGTPVE
ncbi:MAG TPA: HEPN domain-containing protein [Candidatus Binatia bacterium]|nr:HEPN domain-containing protein [Candidatus Binatia bacterium]